MNRDSLIREAVLAWAADLTVNRDVFPDRIKAAVYDSVSGIGEIQAWVQVTSVGVTPTEYTQSPVEIGGRNIAVLSAGRLLVTEGSFL